MALLNWGGRYDLSTNRVYKNGGDTTGTLYVGLTSGDDYLKLLFTSAVDGNTGHIITHGIDYTPDYDGTHRGFVPNYSLSTLDSSVTWDTEKSKTNALLFGDGKWRYIRAVDLPMVDYSELNSESYTDEVLFSAASTVDLVDAKIANAFKANDAMQFKGGIIDIDLNNKRILVDENTYVNFSDLLAGDTYRATATFDVDGVSIESGDLIIVNEDYSLEGGFGLDSFTIVEGNVKGTVENILNGTSKQQLASEGGAAFNFYAPTDSGTANQLLLSAGKDNAPVWGAITSANKNAALSNDLLALIVKEIINIAPTGLTYKALDGTTTETIAFDAGTYNFDISGNSGSANKVNNKLTLTVGTGLSLPETVFDGSSAVSSKIDLAPATYSAIGGVIVVGTKTGNTNYAEGKTISVSTDGEIYLTSDNIAAALGFMPGNTDNSYTYTLVHGNDEHSSPNNTTVSSNPYIHLMGKKEGETNYSSSAALQLFGENITVSANNGTLTFALNAAKTDAIGGIKVGKVNDASITGAISSNDPVENRYYAVETDKDNKAYVYVPWKDESYAFNKFVISNDGSTNTEIEADLVSDTLTLLGGCGITLTADATAGSIKINTNLKGTGHTTITPENDSTGVGAVTINSTWRDIYLNDTLVSQDNAIKYVSTSDILVASVDDTSTNETEVGFCIAWYNIDTEKQEYVSPEITGKTTTN